MSNNPLDDLMQALENNDPDAVLAMKRQVPAARLRELMSPWRWTQRDGSHVRVTRSMKDHITRHVRYWLHSSVEPGPTYPINVCTVGVVSCEVLDEHVEILVDDPEVGAIGQRVSNV